MKQLVTGVIALMLSLSAMAEATEGVGGGHGVVCRAYKGGPIQSVQLLDHYEATNVYSFTGIDMGPSYSYKDKINYVINRLAKIDPLMAGLIEKEISEFNAEDFLIEKHALKHIYDTQEDILFKDSCLLEQFAINKKNLLLGEKPYLIVKELWNSSSSETRAGTSLHEVIYRLFKKNSSKIKNSKAARYYNALISSKEFNTYTVEMYKDAVYSLASEVQFSYHIFSTLQRAHNYNLLTDFNGSIINLKAIPEKINAKFSTNPAFESWYKTNQILFEGFGSQKRLSTGIRISTNDEGLIELPDQLNVRKLTNLKNGISYSNAYMYKNRTKDNTFISFNTGYRTEIDFNGAKIVVDDKACKKKHRYIIDIETFNLKLSSDTISEGCTLAPFTKALSSNAVATVKSISLHPNGYIRRLNYEIVQPFKMFQNSKLSRKFKKKHIGDTWTFKSEENELLKLIFQQTE